MSADIKTQTPPNLETRTLIAIFINLKNGESYKFIAPSGEGIKIMQRVRSEIARLRNKLEEAGKKKREFRLLSPIELTAEGDVVTVTLVQTTKNALDELAADLALGEDL